MPCGYPQNTQQALGLKNECNYWREWGEFQTIFSTSHMGTKKKTKETLTTWVEIRALMILHEGCWHDFPP